jgi:hypothetical protein
MAHQQVCEYLEKSIKVGFQESTMADGLISNSLYVGGFS